MGNKIKLGSHVIDMLTELQGTVIGETLWLYGCSRIIIQPKDVKDGKMAESVVVDKRSVKLSGVVARTDEIEANLINTRVGLGDEVKDIISGFPGVVVAKTAWLHGCMRITVASRNLYEGKVIPNQTFDEPQIEVIAKGAFKAETLEVTDKQETKSTKEVPTYGDDLTDPLRVDEPDRGHDVEMR